MKLDSLVPNIAMLLVAMGIIGVTIFERLSSPSAPAFLVILSIFSVFAAAVAVSNIRFELRNIIKK